MHVFTTTIIKNIKFFPINECINLIYIIVIITTKTLNLYNDVTFTVNNYYKRMQFTYIIFTTRAKKRIALATFFFFSYHLKIFYLATNHHISNKHNAKKIIFIFYLKTSFHHVRLGIFPYYNQPSS